MMKLTTFLKLSSILTALSLAGCSSDVTSAAPGNGIHRVDLYASYNKPRTLESRRRRCIGGSIEGAK